MITAGKLKTGSNFLQQQLASRQIRHDDNLESKVLLKYSQQTLNQLTAILNKSQTPERLIAQLELFLWDHWRLVQGTMLSYTALPHHEVTAILVAVAQYLAQEKNKIKSKADIPAASVKLLMPTVNTESVSDDYPSLEPIFDEVQGEWVDVDLANVLQTHSLSTQGVSLLPVRLFAALDMGIDSQQIINPYFDYKHHAADTAYLHDDEYERLSQHSLLTKAIFEAKKNYETLLSDQNNLLGHLRELCLKLIFNSVQVAGRELDASGGAYAAILEFNAYYQQIGVEEQHKIPRRLKLKIESLIRLISEPLFNRENTQQGETCVVVIRRSLVDAMAGCERELSVIGLQGENKAERLSQAKVQLDSCQKELLKRLNQGEYAGQDNWGLTLPLMTHLELDFSIRSDSDLKTVQTLSNTAIKDFFRHQTLQKQWAYQLRLSENLVNFCMGMAPATLKSLLILVAQELSQSVLRSPRDVLALLTGLDTARCQLVCDTLKLVFHQILNSADRVDNVFRYLEPERRTLVCHAIFDPIDVNLSSLMTSAGDFRDLLQHLNLEQRELIFVAVRHQIPRWIKSTSDFKTFLHNLNSQQRTQVYDMMKNSLPKMITESWDVANVLQYLNTGQRAELFNGTLTSLIVRKFSQSDAVFFLKDIFAYLDNNQFRRTCELLRGKLTSIEHFFRVFESFDSFDGDKKSIFYDVLRAELPKLIKSAADFCFIISNLSPKECQFVLVSCQSAHEQRLPWDFTPLLASLEHSSEAHCDVIFEVLKNDLPQSGKQVYYLMNYFRTKHDQLLHESLKARLPGMIQSGADFKDTLHHLNASQRVFIYDLLKAYLPQCISSEGDLHEVLAYLTQDQRTAMCAAIKKQLPNLILSTQSLANLLWLLPLDGRKLVYEAMVGETVSEAINDNFLLRVDDVTLEIQPSMHFLEYFLSKEECANKQRQSQAQKMRFELALAWGDLGKIQAEFGRLIIQVNRHRSTFFVGAYTRSCVELIGAIAELKNKQHLKTLCDALQLHVTSPQLNSSRAIKKALFDYIQHRASDIESDKSLANTQAS